jgi:XTP/dITP diphosphohydrolase
MARAAESGVTARRVVLASGNPHKVAEIVDILGAAFAIEAVDLDTVEDGATFEENAVLKAAVAANVTGQLALADDSGIEVAALGGAPGIHSARWTHEADWIPRLLRELDATGDRERRARFVCAAVAVWPGEDRRVVVRGEVEGHIAAEPRGREGFGYDPVFVPDEGDGRTFGEMTAAEKRGLSHRARAFDALRDRLG